MGIEQDIIAELIKRTREGRAAWRETTGAALAPRWELEVEDQVVVVTTYPREGESIALAQLERVDDREKSLLNLGEAQGLAKLLAERFPPRTVQYKAQTLNAVLEHLKQL